MAPHLSSVYVSGWQVQQTLPAARCPLARRRPPLPRWPCARALKHGWPPIGAISRRRLARGAIGEKGANSRRVLVRARARSPARRRRLPTSPAPTSRTTPTPPCPTRSTSSSAPRCAAMPARDREHVTVRLLFGARAGLPRAQTARGPQLDGARHARTHPAVSAEARRQLQRQRAPRSRCAPAHAQRGLLSSPHRGRRHRPRRPDRCDAPGVRAPTAALPPALTSDAATDQAHDRGGRRGHPLRGPEAGYARVPPRAWC
jgi:hypothetical protein